MESERTSLLSEVRTQGLSWMFATFCIIDLFGVFPIVTLPRAIIDCGWVGIPLSVAVLVAQMYTAYLLGKCWIMAEELEPAIVHKSRYPYAAIAELCYGVNMSRCVTIILQVTIFGGGIPNLIVASQMLHLVGLKTTEFQLDFSYCYWMIILGVVLCPVMWLGSPKDMKFLAVTSCVVVAVVATLTWTCILQDRPEDVDRAQPEPTWEAIAIAYGILAFQFDVHPLILTIQVDMENKKRLGRAILGAFAVTGGLSIVTTVLAREKYGVDVTRNLLQILPGSAMLYVTIVLVTLQIGMSMVVGGSALFQDIEEKLNIPKDFNWKRCVVRSIILMSAVLIGEFVPRFDLVMGFIGGAFTSPLMFLFPTFFYLRLRTLLHRHHQRHLDRLQSAYYEKPASYNPYFRCADICLATPEQMYFHRNCAHDLHCKGSAGFEQLCFEPVLPSAGEDRLVEGSYYGDDFMRPRTPAGLAAPEPEAAGPPGYCEKIICGVIMALGLLALGASTFVSLVETLRVAQISHPCFL